MTDILFGTQVRREFFIGGLKKPDARDQRVAAGCTSRKLCVEVRSAAQKVRDLHLPPHDSGKPASRINSARTRLNRPRRSD
jgi:hypothetical protein